MIYLIRFSYISVHLGTSFQHLAGDIDGRGLMKKVTDGKIGAEGGLEFGIFAVTSFLNVPSGAQLYLLKADQSRPRAILRIFSTSS